MFWILGIIVLVVGVRVLILAGDETVEPDRLKKVAGTRSRKVAMVLGIVGTIIGALIVIAGLVWH